MRALCWEGVHKIRVENVPDPTIINPRDAIIKVTLTAICGSDLHLYDGYIPSMQKTRLGTDRPHALRQVIQACRKGGTVSVPGVYGGFLDKFPFGAAFAKGLSFRMGQTHVHRYLRPLLERIQRGDIDPSFVITHRLTLDEGPEGYDIFKHKEDNCIKVVLKP